MQLMHGFGRLDELPSAAISLLIAGNIVVCSTCSMSTGKNKREKYRWIIFRQTLFFSRSQTHRKQSNRRYWQQGDECQKGERAWTQSTRTGVRKNNESYYHLPILLRRLHVFRMHWTHSNAGVVLATADHYATQTGFMALWHVRSFIVRFVFSYAYFLFDAICLVKWKVFHQIKFRSKRMIDMVVVWLLSNSSQ